MPLNRSMSLVGKILFIAAPLLFLAGDVVSSPGIFQNRPTIKTVNLNLLLATGLQRLGTFERHQMHISIDDISSENFLGDVVSDRNALVISAFKEGRDISLAALGVAAMKRLERISPADWHSIQTYLDSPSHVRTGSILRIELHVPQSKRSRFPVDELYMAVFEKGVPIDAVELGSAVSSASKLGNQQGIKNLILPCLGQVWQHPNDADSLTFKDYFPAVFQSIGPDADSPNIRVSLYRQWPSFELEEAIGQFNSSWEDAAYSQMSETRSTFFHSQFRTLMLSCALCLFVCVFLIEPSVKSCLIISVSYLGLALGSDTMVKFFTEGHPRFAPILHVGTLLFLAVGFPFIVLWSPKDLFSKKEK
ncbi:MAG: hypothetical protein JWM08_957 [Candidatus Angelobacter sp.]|nr:hypothetical protein [Candidatus Angelobacter sp.]